MLKTVFALVLMAVSGTALAYQSTSGDAAVQPADGEEAAATADEEQLSDKEVYRAAVKAFSKCRQNARRDNTPAAAANACSSQRKRMLAAKESLRGSK
jgi:hypothetical protein